MYPGLTRVFLLWNYLFVLPEIKSCLIDFKELHNTIALNDFPY